MLAPGSVFRNKSERKDKLNDWKLYQQNLSSKKQEMGTRKLLKSPNLALMLILAKNIKWIFFQLLAVKYLVEEIFSKSPTRPAKKYGIKGVSTTASMKMRYPAFLVAVENFYRELKSIKLQAHFKTPSASEILGRGIPLASQLWPHTWIRAICLESQKVLLSSVMTLFIHITLTRQWLAKAM